MTLLRRTASLITVIAALCILLPALSAEALAAKHVHLRHNGSVTNFATIQAAVDAAVDGDTVVIGAGTFVEQVVVTKAITLRGVGRRRTVIAAPDNAAMVASSQNSMRNMTRWAILDLRTATPGSGTIRVRDLSIDGRYQGPTQAQDAGNTINMSGIAAYDTNAIIDNVNIQHIAALWDVYGNLEGLTRDECILAEGTPALGSEKVRVVVKNSTLGTFQKAGIDAWGANLHVVIHSNHISGSGVRGLSGQNGIQIGSWNLDRPGTTGIIARNRIDMLGAPDDLVTAGWTATGIYPVTAGAVRIHDNRVVLSPCASPLGLVGVDVGYGVYDPRSGRAYVYDNVLKGMSVGIQVDSASTSAVHIFRRNRLVSDGGEPIVYWYDPVGNGDVGGETLAIFKPSAIRVVGEDFSGPATVGDGTGLAANSVQMLVSGGNTTLYIDTTNAGASTPITLRLIGAYDPADLTLDGEYIRIRGRRQL